MRSSRWPLFLTFCLPLWLSTASPGICQDAKEPAETLRLPGIDPLPPEKLPPRTRPKPDPEKMQHRREAVYVRISERVQPSKDFREGKEYVPEVAVVENYLAEYLRRAGHPVVSSPGAAIYRVEGAIRGEFVDYIKFMNRVIAWKYSGFAALQVLDGEGRELERVEIAEHLEENTVGEESAALHLRRHLAKLIHDKLFDEGKVFARQEVPKLLAALLEDPLTAAEPVSGEEVVERLADIGFPAVPYLLEALTNTRTVLVDARYPGLQKLDDLKVYHLADKALEEIFQKVSRLNLKSGIDERYVVIRGWENEWRRFCPAFRESPEAKKQAERREKATASPKKEGEG
jgi:hypothetical protein